jgi:hypothetical protein
MDSPQMATNLIMPFYRATDNIPDISSNKNLPRYMLKLAINASVETDPGVEAAGR